MSRSRTQYAVLNISSNFAGYFINTVVGFVCRMVFVRCLTAEHLGVAGLFTNIIMMLSLSELGLGAVMTHALYEPIAKDNKAKVAALMRYFARVYRTIFGFFVVVGIALVPYLDFFVKNPPDINENFSIIYLLFLFSTAVSYLFAHQTLFLMASQKQYVVTTVNYIITIVQSCLQMVFLFLTRNYIHYLLIQVAGSVLQFLCISCLVRKENRGDNDTYHLTKQDKRGLFSNVWRLSLGRLSGFLVNGTDNIIISKLVGIASVGLLTNYVLLIKTIDTLILSIMNSISAGIGNYNALSGKETTAGLFRNVCFLMFVVYGLVSVVFYVSANDLVRLLFGDKYVMGPLVCALLTLNFFMLGLINLVGTFMNAVGVFTKGRLVVVLTAVLNIALSIWFGMKWGVVGVLAATAVARLVTNWWFQPRALFKYGFGCSCSAYFLNYACFVVIIAASLFLSQLTCSQMDVQSVWVFMPLKVLVSSVLFLAIVFGVYRKSSEFAYMCVKINQLHGSLLARRFS